MSRIQSHPSPLGPLYALSSDQGVVALGWSELAIRRLTSRPGISGDPHGLGAALASWFAGDLTALDALPIDPIGTAYQRRVWDRLRALPAGQTTSYGALARELRTSARAVGNANARNPVALIVPCHRVIGSDGALTGYAYGLSRKAWLLDHEAAPAQEDSPASRSQRMAAPAPSARRVPA